VAETNWAVVITATGAAPTIVFKTGLASYNRSGNRANLMVVANRAVDMAAGSGLYLAAMPAGLLIDSNNVIFDDGVTYKGSHVGSGRVATVNGALFGIMNIKPYSPTMFCANVMLSTGVLGYWSSTFIPWVAPINMSFTCSVPIAGWI
jgi:hypothetical protein